MEINGRQLQFLRRFKTIKQNTLAKGLGISQPAYWEWEQCRSIRGEKLEKALSVMDYTWEEAKELIGRMPPLQ